MATLSKTKRQRGAGTAAVALALLAAGCKDEASACYDLSVGEELEVALVERYDAASQFPGAQELGTSSCPDGSPISAGDTLAITVERQAIDDVDVVECKSSLFSVENAGALGLGNAVSRTRDISPQDPLVANFTATVADCAALVQLRIDERRTTGDLEAVSMPGQVPHFVLRRELVFSDGCAASCADEFVVSIKKFR